ncbi:HigA family addiction module antitoxin [Rhizorhabdus argentea]|uniref:HigA family addiction module antitoxin n=1 Tax=Rhizorhabdus argentea TaxID=1387174 RepID=UPI003BF467B3
MTWRCRFGEWKFGHVILKDLAAHCGVSRQALSTLLNGHASLTAEMAIRFEKAFGVSADTLMRMQTAYDLAQARRTHAGEIKVSRLEMAARVAGES